MRQRIPRIRDPMTAQRRSRRQRIDPQSQHGPAHRPAAGSRPSPRYGRPGLRRQVPRGSGKGAPHDPRQLDDRCRRGGFRSARLAHVMRDSPVPGPGERWSAPGARASAFMENNDAPQSYTSAYVETSRRSRVPRSPRPKRDGCRRVCLDRVLPGRQCSSTTARNRTWSVSSSATGHRVITGQAFQQRPPAARPVMCVVQVRRC